MKYYGVLFKKDTIEGYGGREYYYCSNLPLEIGDKVMLPTAKGEDSKGIVTNKIDFAPPYPCREITEYDLGKENKND